MALELELETLENVDESVRTLYKNENGKYVLDVNLNDKYIPAESVAGLKTNHDKLLAEKKAAQRKAEESLEETRLAQEAAAKKNGDLESLTKSWQEKEAAYQTKLNQLEKKEAERIRDLAARDLASQLADGSNAKLLSRFISDRLKVEAGELKVLDKSGNLTISTLADLKKEFESDPDFESLRVGSLATGSGATRSGGGTVANKTITQKQFDSMTHFERSQFFKSGGEVA